MKKIFIYSSTLMLLLFCHTAVAQNTDSLLLQTKRAYDSLAKLVYPHYVVDTINKRLVLQKAKSLQLTERQDTLTRKHKALLDSVRGKLYLSYNATDSLYGIRATKYRSFDSVKRKALRSTYTADSVYKKNRLFANRYDSIKRIHTVRLDSFHKYRLALSVKLDSVKRKVFLKQVKSDSLRIKKYLLERKLLLQKMYTDTITLKNGYRSKKLTTEISCFEGDTVYINNNYKKVIIKTVPSQRVRLSSVIVYKEALNERDQQLFKKMGIEISRDKHSVTATINSTRLPLTGKKIGACDEIANSETNLKRPLLIEVPGNAILVILSKYADANIENYVHTVNAQMMYGNLTMNNAGTVSIKGSNAVIKAGNMDEATLNLTASRFSASNIAGMSVISSTSVLKLNSCSKMKINSTGDAFTIDNAGSITGNQNFGKLNIENLKEGLVLSGTGAAIEIVNFSLGTPLIKIDGKFADVKLPLSRQENFAVYYEGSYNDVNNASYATTKITDAGKIDATFSLQKDTLKQPLDINRTVLKAIAGNITDKHTKIDIVCPYCNVVFN